MKKAKKQPKITIESFGRYTTWDRSSKELPRILEFTNTIQCKEGNEFGMILQISGGKGCEFEYCIKHPPFKDETGGIFPDITGSYFVNSNDHKFFIGDCIWLPVEDKKGVWEVEVTYEGELIAHKKFEMIE